MDCKSALVITSIASPNKALKVIAENCLSRELDFWVMGDRKSPDDFNLEGCTFYSLEKQRELSFKLAGPCPENHYVRKNLGYLLAIEKGHKIIIETDDDNIPQDNFWNVRSLLHTVSSFENCGWLNVYKYFSDAHIWPRGFPLEYVKNDVPLKNDQSLVAMLTCPIQQGLADMNPDVDAVYRMLMELPVSFQKNTNVALGKNTWCPFNSQNTTWFKEAFPLMYLPAYCNFRMTDIWRSFVAQRIAWTCGWHVLFHSATVYQERNEHQLQQDFVDEIPGYLHNVSICQALAKLDLKNGIEHIFENLWRCYELFVENKWVNEKELNLLNLWIEDLMPYVE